MKVTVNGRELARVAAIVNGVTAKNKSIAAIDCIYLKAESGTLSLAGTDTIQRMSIVIPADVKDEGRALLQAHRFTSIAKELAGGDILITGKSWESMQVKGSGSTFKLTGQNPDDFPSPADPDGVSEIQIQAGFLATAIRQASNFVSENTADTGRRYLLGVHAKFGGPSALIEASDGRRLMQMTIPLEQEAPTIEAVIPPEIESSVSSVLALDEKATVLFAGREIGFRSERATLWARLYEAKYIDTAPWINPLLEQPLRATVKAQDLQGALRKVRLVVEGDKSKRVALIFGDGLLRITGSTPEGEAEAEVPCEWKHDPVTMNFNSTFLLDYLGLLPPSIEIEMRLDKDPRAMAVVGQGMPSYFIVPMKA